MGRAFHYVIVGGGVSAGYAALEFASHGISHGDVCIVSAESVAPYERPALSKGFLLPEGAARLPSFHTCVGTKQERLTPKWYKEHGIELILGTSVKSVDLNHRRLTTAAGETIIYEILIIATGARALRLEEFGVSGANAQNICYLRDLQDATKLLDVMKSCSGSRAVVIGGGYIGMECGAALVNNKIDVTMVFPENHCMARLFTPEIAAYYENYYEEKGVQFIKGAGISSFDSDSDGKVTAVNLKDGRRLEADMVVVGIGIKANTELFEEQVCVENGGIKVNGRMQTSHSYTYAVGDVASFPLKRSGQTRRLEHVDFARKSAVHAVRAIMASTAGSRAADLDYVPYFYSRVFTLSWQFFGDNAGEAVHFGDASAGKLGAYWIHKRHVVGAFLEGGNALDYEALALVAALRPALDAGAEISELSASGLQFALALQEQQRQQKQQHKSICVSMSTNTRAAVALRGVGVAAALAVAAAAASFAVWYAKRRRRRTLALLYR